MGWARFFRRTQRDAELADELESYLAHEAGERITEGAAADDARWRHYGTSSLVTNYELRTPSTKLRGLPGTFKSLEFRTRNSSLVTRSWSVVARTRN